MKTKQPPSHLYGLQVCKRAAAYYLRWEYGHSKASDMLKSLPKHPSGLLWLLPMPRFMQPDSRSALDWRSQSLAFYARVMEIGHTTKARLARYGLGSDFNITICLNKPAILNP